MIKKLTLIISIFSLFSVTYLIKNNDKKPTKNATHKNTSTIKIKLEESKKTENKKNLIIELQKEIHSEAEKIKSKLSFWIKKNPLLVMNYLLTINKNKFQTNTLALAMEIWHKNDKQAFNHWLLTAPTSKTLDDSIVFFCSLNNLPPKTYIQYARSINNINKQDDTTLEILKNWIRYDAEGAILWMIDDYDGYQRFGTESYKAIIEADFNTALLSLPLLHTGDISISKNIIDIFITKLYKSTNNQNTDIDLIKTSLLTLPESDFKDMALLSLAPIIFKLGDAYDGINFMEMIPTGKTRNSLEHNFINLLIEQDATIALDYLSQADTENRQKIQNIIITQWAQKDLEATDEWLKKSDINSVDIILPLVQTAINKKKPTIAIEWIERIGGDQETIELKFKIAKLLYKENPQSAQKYLQDISQITNEEKDKIFQYIENNQNI